MTEEKIYQMSFARVYGLLVNKALRKGRTREEVEEAVCWLTGYDPDQLHSLEQSDISYGDFFTNAPEMNPAREKITGTVCGVRVENVQPPLMREIRRLDKLIDELAKGRPMDKILRT